MNEDKITIEPWEPWEDNHAVVSAFRWVHRKDAKGNVDSKRISVRVSKRDEDHLLEVYDLNGDYGTARLCNDIAELLNRLEEEMDNIKEGGSEYLRIN